MRLGVNVPNYGPGTDPGVLREWGRVVEEAGFDLLMVSDHVVVTPDVAVQYPEPFFEPFTTLSWLADTVVLDPYHGDPKETRQPDVAWQALTTVATHWRTAS